MPKPADLPDPQSDSPKRASGWLRRMLSRGARENLWALLDALDARPALKRSLIIGVPALLVLSGLGVWGYQHWARTNAIRIARQWLDAGRLDRAGAAVQDALSAEPDLPVSWSLASELAWRKGNRPASVEYARKAAAVGNYQAADVLAWAEASVLADDMEQAGQAMGHIDAATAAESPRALRLSGEIARRGHQFEEARDRFQAALRLDAGAGAGPLATDEVPLGIVCLQTGSPVDRKRGQALLAKWAPDLNWGTEALRALLADAVAHGDRAATAHWAQALSQHPRCTLGDVPVCLKALADSDPAAFHSMLAALEEKSAPDPNKSAQLLGWLTEIDQGAEAVRWGESLEPSTSMKPPIAVGIAEALRATQRWADLQAWLDRGDWGRDLEFERWALGMVAARQLGDAARADALWESLLSDGRLNPAHALFAGEALYAWGYPKESAELLWVAADRAELAYQALGSLARLYQVERDAAGQYKAWSRLNAMQPSDRKIANNFAYYAALTDLGSQTKVGKIAQDNFEKEPDNAVYRSTLAFVLVWGGQATRALKLMEPLAGEWRKSPAVAFAYGAALAGVGRKPEAKEVFYSLNPRELSPRETEWIQNALR